MTVAISQSNYIPWRGYFDMIARSDVFVVYDDMQYTRRDWRNRNKIKTPQGMQWLTIPVNVKGKYHQKINQTQISDSDWASRHLKAIYLNYKKAAHFEEMYPKLEEMYKEAEGMDRLSEVNAFFVKEIMGLLDITTRILPSSSFDIRGSKTDALLSVLEQLDGVDTYISGPAAKDYLETEKFDEAGIEVEWMDYSRYPKYPQLHGEFEPGVSVLDLLLNEGNESGKYIKRVWRK